MQKIIELFNKYKEIIMYLIFGVLTTVVSLVTYYALTLTILNPEKAMQLQLANIISWIVSVAFAYVTNRKFVFKSKNKNIISEFIKFIMSRILSLLMDMGTMFIIVSILSFSDVIGKVISQIIVIIANYVLSKLIVFKK